MFGSWALAQGHRLSLYSPGCEDHVIPRSIIADLRILSLERARLTAMETEPLTVLESSDFTGVDIILVPNVDVMPGDENEDYVDTLMNTFRNLKSERPKMEDKVKILFGRNVSGLVAAKAWDLIFPLMRKQLYVTSSVFAASAKVFGGTKDRAILVKRLASTVVFSSTSQSSEIAGMMKSWSLHEYTAIESKALVEFVLADEKEQLGRVDLIGRFPTTEEVTKYGIMADIPAVLPVVNEMLAPDWFTEAIIESVRDNSEWINACFQLYLQQ